jgi:hypothetical protein
MGNRKSNLCPVPKKQVSNAAHVAESTDLLWTDEEAQAIVAQAADHLAASAGQLSSRFDLDFVEALLWVVERVCDHAGLPPLVYPEPIP